MRRHRNHFFYEMAAADRTEGGQVEPVLGAYSFNHRSSHP